MREFNFTIREGLSKGLRRDRSASRALGRLASLSGLRGREDGLSGISPVTMPGIQWQVAEWPWPQYFHGREQGILADKTLIYEIDRSDWTASPVNFLDPANPPALGVITAGGCWHFFDAGGRWAATNGVCLADGLGPTTAYIRDIQVATVCGHRGRVLWGGIEGMADAWQTWMTASTSLAGSAKKALTDGGRMVAWSSVGGGNALWPWQRTDANVEMLERGDCGFAMVPLAGDVLAILPMGKMAMVYSANGICAMTPVAEPVPTYGLEVVSGIGAAGRGAVGGDNERHLLIDHSGTAWMVTPDGIERLGYREFFEPLLGDEIVVSYDAREQEFRVCGQSAGYLLTKTGLSKMTELVSSTAFTEGGTVGTSDGADAGAWTLETGPFDLDMRAIKTIAAVEVGGYGLGTIEVSIGWLTEAGVWRWSVWQRANAQGFVMPNVAATDLKIRLKGTAPVIADAQMDFINVRAKLIDYRSVRSRTGEAF